MNFLKRIRIKLNLKKKIQKVPSALFYSLPVISQYNPRKKITKFKDWCAEVKRFPKKDEISPKNWYLAVRSSQSVYREQPISLSNSDTEKFFRSVNSYQWGCEYTLPEIFIACLNNAKIYSKDFLILSDSNHIFYDSIWSNQKYLESNGILDKIGLPIPKSYSGAACVLGTLG